MQEEIIPSPCVGKCKQVNNHCKGCKRTLNEIKHWFSMSNEDKIKCLKRIGKYKNG